MLRTILSGRMAVGWGRSMRGLCLLGIMAPGGMALAAVSQSPVFLAQPVKPNIMYTLDNSGSMVWGSLTGYDGSAEYSKSKRAYYSSSYNGMWYNPAITYTPAVTYDGKSLFASGVASGAASVPSKALLNPFSSSTSNSDLTATCWSTSLPSLPTPTCYSSSSSGHPIQISKLAFYYLWDGTTNITTATPSDSAFPTRVNIISATPTYLRAAGRTDCGTGTTCTYAQEIQNFANWYTYYRTRILMQKTAMGLAFANLDPVLATTYTPKFRVGFNTINPIDSSGNVGYNNTDVSDGADWLTIRDFDKTQKQSFFTKLYAINPSNGTPLRSQMDRIGQLYAGTLTGFDYTNNDPYRLSAADSTLVSCRSSYHIMSTDGYWNDDYSGVGDVDGDGSADTLADIALKYYNTDLRSTLANNVKFKVGAKDNVAWQHMTTFTIGLGANGTFAYDPNYEAATPAFTTIKAGANTWQPPVADQPTTIDDLWHAAINGRGHYYSAKNPNDLLSGLLSVLRSIDDASGAAASVAVTSTSVSGGNAVEYQPSFESGAWRGHLQAYSIDAQGQLVLPMKWDAATLIPAFGSRNIVTWNPSGTPAAVTFDWANLTTGANSQQSSLGSPAVLDYLKGDGSNEQTSAGQGPGIYRYRASKLGDIVNSAPLYVQSANFGYQVLPAASGGGSTYGSFLSTKAARTAMLYVGANDGMLHAFNASTGVESFAYVPNSLFDNVSFNLKSLSDPGYVHKYFVDGPLAEGDAYIGGAWKNYLIGSTGAGAKSVFGLDITTPASLGTSSVKWEKNSGDTGYGDLGNVLGRAAVVHMRDGSWAAIFGNGYDSASGNSVLFIVNISTGAVIKTIPVGTASGGLSTPALLFNQQRELIGAYAGDVQGNLWKFDLSGTSATAWTGSRLFTASNGTQAQPIIQKPVILAHPNGGYLIVIGTGKFYETADKTNTDVQSLYGIWDKPGVTTAVSGRSALVQQTLTAVTGGRTLTANPIDWTSKLGWYIDLLGSGERVVGDMSVESNLILFATTFAPTTSICDGGGTSQFMGVNFLTGGATSALVFKNVDGTDMLSGTTILSSVTIGGTATNPVGINTGNGKRIMKFNKIDGTQQDQQLKINQGPFRSWHQLTVH